ncbi:hypothetical protein LTSEALA_3365 [Salmonella enterica subsp. enterica serovar Alachua str. R6-377]|uniref:Uncharacterized protein n=1 Tax=Salmonella enterica subsp. enterica serovar Alachua str. R6-377 TaxID=913241 RepID=G5LR64_SALET|nr:hypothetical protein LTSEALA_3365 [Salmonella enterica subsp. enterica serovar Alachua str. R6-377]
MKRGSLNIQRQREQHIACVDSRDNLPHPLLKKRVSRFVAGRREQGV